MTLSPEPPVAPAPVPSAGCGSAGDRAFPLPSAAWAWIRYTVAAVLVVAVIGFGLHLHGHADYRPGAASFALWSGAVFGLLLQRSRFCFFCCLYDLFEERDARGTLGLLTALAVGTLGYLVVFGAWIMDPSAGYLPRMAHIGPVGWHLIPGGLAFGVGMALAGSCISAQIYRLGEGSLLSPFALLGSAGGFVLGFLTWNRLYIGVISEAPVVWLPTRLGYAWTVAIYLAVLLGVAVALLRYVKLPGRTEGRLTLRTAARGVFQDRWPTWIGGVGVGVLGTFTLLRTQPLGVTAELGRLSRVAADILGWLPDRLEGLDGFRGCSTAGGGVGLTSNALFVLGLVAAALACGLTAHQFRPRLPKLRAFPLALMGGVLMGWGAMVSLGCTVGTLLSGIHAFAASGWVFTAAMLAGVWLGIRIRLRAGI